MGFVQPVENTVQYAVLETFKNGVLEREQPVRCCLVSKKREQPVSDSAREVRLGIKKVLSCEQEARTARQVRLSEQERCS
jgi:hypothetical protein